MNVKRNIRMLVTAVVAFLIMWSALSTSGGRAACVVSGDECVPALFEKLGFPEGRQ